MDKGTDGECNQRRQTDGCFITGCKHASAGFVMILMFLRNECWPEHRRNREKESNAGKGEVESEFKSSFCQRDEPNGPLSSSASFNYTRREKNGTT